MMEKNIKDYLHLYLGCDVIHKDGTTAKLVSTTTMGECAFIHNDTNQFGTSTPEEFGRLILRPLSDMTDEENNEWAETNGLPSRYEDEANATKYLLSRGFDLFGLIDAGLAIAIKH